MVQYNAFNVDPLRYQQAAMGNVMGAVEMRDRRDQSAARNALYERGLDQGQERFEAQHGLNVRQHEDLQLHRGNVEAKQIEAAAEAKEAEKRNFKARTFSDAIRSGKPVETLTAYKNMFPDLLGDIDPSAFEFMLGGTEPGKIIDRSIPGHVFEISGTNEDIANFTTALATAMPKTKADLIQLAAQHQVAFNELQDKPEKPERFQPNEAVKAEVSMLYRQVTDNDKILRDGYRPDEYGEPVPLSPEEKRHLTLDRGIRREVATALAEGRSPNFTKAMFGNMNHDPFNFGQRVTQYFEEGFFNTPAAREQGLKWLYEAREKHEVQQQRAQDEAERAAAKAEAKQQVAELAKQQRKNARRGGSTATSAATDDEFKPKLSPFGQKAADFASQGYGRSDTTPKDLAVDPEVLTGEGAMRLAKPSSDSKNPTFRINLGGVEQDIPLLVPTLTEKEKAHLRRKGQPTQAILEKAIKYAQEQSQR